MHTVIRKTNVALYKQQEAMTLPPARGAAGPSAVKTSNTKMMGVGGRKGGGLFFLLCYVT